ncbi:hypothetical protein DL762_005455 [Monosporascus cannonballus]|uniref:FAD-binding PCMH-type domain-containing protein n=1 Tax=Monosporascus cannonballus TaxID=155416 RepID=A0ABY0H947_9PEZI|nr:hypothetical protein DL762_005455 [Monosporascus cannonballus]
MKRLLLPLSVIAKAVTVSGSAACRCQPDQPCWPSPQQWSALNHSIDGNLVSVRPVGMACYESPSSAACQEVTALWSNSTWRAAQPGTVQWENWEAWPEHNESCYLESVSYKGCRQGRISLYSAAARSEHHIQEAVRFAERHNLRLVIKNSGHDFLGRSTAPNSLQILTNRMKGIRIVDNFVPKGAPNGKGQGPAVTLDAGVSLQEMYAALAKSNRIVVGGASHTVGPAGGYIQGGGHSFLGTWKGMASDNALEFTVVTSTGDLVIANAYQNCDLFWALRGGGGGTFGVVTKATLRTFDDAPMVLTNLNISTTVGDPGFWSAMEDFHAALPALNGAGGAGYYFLLPNLPWAENQSISSFTLMLVFANATSTAGIDRTYEPLLEKLNATSGVTTQYASAVLPSVHYLISNILITGDADVTGRVALLGSRLFSRDLLVSKDGPARLVSALKQFRYDPGQPMIGHVVAGGAVADNARKVDSALNPAWRKAIVHIVNGRGWSVNATWAQQQAIINNATNVELPLLQAVEGAHEMGAYLNEASAYEPNFQQSFWGSNYPRLYKIKQKWDPKGIFLARKTVGSEDWDDEGLCRFVK